MNSTIKLGAAVGLTAVLILGFQNCSKIGFSGQTGSGNVSAAGSDGAGSGQDSPPGPAPAGPLIGGHFDIDTSHEVYALSQGTTDFHVHDYSDLYNTSVADLFNLDNPGLESIPQLVGQSQRFIIIVANSQLSPGGVLEINGSNVSVTDYQTQVDNLLAQGKLPQVYELAGPITSGDQILSSLKVAFAKDVIQAGGLIPTDTPCVRANDPGLNGEYRNGALTIQLLDPSLAKIDSTTQAATATGGLIYETTLFYHWTGGCYGGSSAGPPPPAPAPPAAP
jgi:hypothetical protein